MNRQLNKNLSSNRWLTVGVCAGIAAVIWIVFGQTRHHDFVNFDDANYISDNPNITQGLNWQGVLRAFTHRHADNWHPLTTLSHMLDCQLYGLNPGGHHVSNVLLHTATAILLFVVLRNMTGAFWRSAFVAVVFAIHPLRVESVAWVSERKDVLSGLFFMLTLWAYGRYADTFKVQGSKFKVYYGLALVFFAGGLMSKPMLVTLPFVLLLLDYWPLRRFEFSTLNSQLSTVLRLVAEKIPFLLLTVGSCAATIWAQQNAISTLQGLTISSRIGSALAGYVAYIGQMFYPAGLAVFYPHPENHLSVGMAVAAGLLLSAVSAGVVAGRRDHPDLLVGWFWYLGMLVPVIGIMQAGVQARADRYTYLPQIGLYILIAWGAVRLSGNWRHHRAVLGAVAVLLCAGLVMAARSQTEYWKNSTALWTHALACTSGNYVAHNNLGIVLGKEGKYTEAIEHFEQALLLQPDYPEAEYNLGIALNNQGKSAEAIPHYQRAVQLKPDSASTHLNLANALTRQGKLTEAISHYEQALQLDPELAEAHNNLANLLSAQGNLTEAIQHLERALQLRPDYAEAHYNLGIALGKTGKATEAIQHLERALQFEPDFAEAHLNLGITLYNLGKKTEAIREFQQALSLATVQNNPALAETIRNRLESVQPASPPAQTP